MQKPFEKLNLRGFFIFKMIDFNQILDGWNTKKKKINQEKIPPLFREREIWLADVWINVWIEQNWNLENFIRPVLILKKFSKNHFLAIPLTSKEKRKPFWFELKSVSFLNRKSWLILTQIKAMDSKRLHRRLWKLPITSFLEIQKSAWKLIQASGA